MVFGIHLLQHRRHRFNEIFDANTKKKKKNENKIQYPFIEYTKVPCLFKVNHSELNNSDSNLRCVHALSKIVHSKRTTRVNHIWCWYKCLLKQSFIIDFNQHLFGIFMCRWLIFYRFPWNGKSFWNIYSFL